MSSEMITTEDGATICATCLDNPCVCHPAYTCLTADRMFLAADAVLSKEEVDAVLEETHQRLRTVLGELYDEKAARRYLARAREIVEGP